MDVLSFLESVNNGNKCSQEERRILLSGHCLPLFFWHPERPHDFQRVLSTIDSRVEHRLLARLLVADMEGDCCLSLLILSFFVTSPKPGLMEKRN